MMSKEKIATIIEVSQIGCRAPSSWVEESAQTKISAIPKKSAPETRKIERRIDWMERAFMRMGRLATSSYSEAIDRWVVIVRMVQEST